MNIPKQHMTLLRILGTIALTATATIGGVVWGLLQPTPRQYINQQIESYPIFLLSVLLIVLVSILLVALYYSYRNKLILALGIYWDKELNPYCPACRNPLSNIAYYATGNRKNKPGLKCIKCNAIIRISTNGNKFLSLDEAIDILSNK